jgi:hypothetical protein
MRKKKIHAYIRKNEMESGKKERRKNYEAKERY